MPRAPAGCGVCCYDDAVQRPARLAAVLSMCGLMTVGVASAVAASGRKVKAGRIVRVQRTGITRALNPRFCSLSGNQRGNCYVRGPEVGEQGFLVDRDDQGVTATIRVTSVEPEQGCATPAQVYFEYEVVSGTADGDSDWVVFDSGIDPLRGKIAPSDTPLPAGAGGDSVWLGLDRDGNGEADLVSSVYQCDGLGQPSSRYGSTYCFEYWEGHGTSPWKLLREDLYQPC